MSDDIAERRLEAAMLAAEVAWWEMDVESGHVDFNENKAEMYGYDADRFDHYEDFTELVHPEDHDRIMDAMRDLIEGRAETYDVQYRIEQASGDVGWCHDVGGVTARDDDGTPTTISGIVVDITDRKHNELALSHRVEQLGWIGDVVSGDVLQRLYAADASLDEAMEALDGDDVEALQTARDRIDEAIQLGYDVRDLVELDWPAEIAGERLDLGPIDVATVVLTEAESFRERHPDASLTVDADPPTMAAATPVLSSVVRHLLENAARFSAEPSPAIDVAVAEDGDAVVVDVELASETIPEDFRQAVLGRADFAPEDSSRLGLYYVHRFVRAFGGEVAVEDDGPGRSVVRLTLDATEAGA